MYNVYSKVFEASRRKLLIDEDKKMSKILLLSLALLLAGCHQGSGIGPAGPYAEGRIGAVPTGGPRGAVIVSPPGSPRVAYGRPGIPVGPGYGPGPDGEYDPTAAMSAPGYGPSPVAKVPEGWHFASFARPPTGRCMPPRQLVITNICRDGPNGMQECKNDCV